MPRNFAALGAAAQPGIRIDIEGLVLEVESRAIDALNQTLIFTHSKAQKYAPVRAIFARTRRGPAFPAMTGVRHAGAEPTRAEIIRAYRRHPISTQRRQESFRASVGHRPRRVNVPQGTYSTYTARELDRAGIPYKMSATAFAEQQRVEKTQLPPGPLDGHNNSIFPVNRSKGETVAGDFRQWRAGKLLDVATVSQVRGGRVATHTQSGDEFLTAKGRYEVKTGRAAFQKAEEPTRIGGALRDSVRIIKATPNSVERGQIIGYVRAGGDGVDYAGYQEFGTRHNRAQPFLRPALYESRAVYKRNVRKAIEGRRRGRASG